MIDLPTVYSDDAWQYAGSVPASITVEVDHTALGSCIARYVKELDIAEKELLPYQMQLLLEEIVAQSPPRSRKQAQSRIRRNIKLALYQKPNEVFTGKKAQGQNGIRWLYASAKFAVGIEPEYIKTDVQSVSELNKLVKDSVKAAKWVPASFSYSGKVNRGYSETQYRKGVDLGERKVWLIKKPMVSRGAYNKMMRLADARPGTLKASWVKAGMSAGVKVRAQAWVMNNIDHARGRGGADLVTPTKRIYAISSSPGVTSTESLRIIENAKAVRRIKMNADIDNQLRGAYKRSGFKLAQ